MTSAFIKKLLYTAVFFLGMTALILFGQKKLGLDFQKSDNVTQIDVSKTMNEATPSLPPTPKSLTLDDIDFNGYSKDLAKFTGLKEGQSRGEAVDNVRLYFAPEQGSQTVSYTHLTLPTKA